MDFEIIGTGDSYLHGSHSRSVGVVDAEFNPISVRGNSAMAVENVASDPGPPPALSDSKVKNKLYIMQGGA